MSETANTNDNTQAFDIEALPITISYVGETTRDNGWKCDEWRVTLQNSAKDRRWTTAYYTGLGLRGKPVLQVTDGGQPPRKHTLLWERIEKSRPPVKPKIADVVYSLCMDATADDYNFHDWCDTYGYSSDSIAALNLYKQCLEIAQNLRSFFTREQRQAIEAIVAEM